MERAGRPRHRSHNPRGEGERAGSERINAFGVSCIARLGGCTLTPNSVDGVEKSVDYYCWQKAAAASPQFARDEPKYDRAKRHNCARPHMDDAEQNGREHNVSRERDTAERESNRPPPLQHGLD